LTAGVTSSGFTSSTALFFELFFIKSKFHYSLLTLHNYTGAAVPMK
jgi:hypothetical protein